MPIDLHYDLAFLKQLLSQAIRLHRPRSVEEATMLADLRDYLMYVALDAMKDPGLAGTLVKHFTRLGAWLTRKLQDTPASKPERETIQFYMGFVFALDQLLSLRHEIAGVPGEHISRQDFMRSWKRSAEKLGL